MSRGEFRLKGGIPCQGGILCRGGFRVGGNSGVEGGIPCRGGITCQGVNSMTRGEFCVEGGIVDTQLYILLKKNFFNVFSINIGVFFFFFKNALAD